MNSDRFLHDIFFPERSDLSLYSAVLHEITTLRVETENSQRKFLSNQIFRIQKIF